MRVKIVGIEKFDFTGSDGKQVNFNRIYCVAQDKKVIGLKCISLNTKLEESNVIEVQNDYDLFFEPDSKGMAKLALIQKVNK